MSNYPAYPPPPPAEGSGYGYGQPSTPAEPPPSIKTAVNIIWALVALTVLGAVLTVAFLDDVVKAAGLDLTAAEQDAARTAAIAGAVVGVLIFGGLFILLAVFLRRRANWARIVLTVLAVLGILGGLYNLATTQPAIFHILNVVELLLYAALIFFLWRRDSSDYLKKRPAPAY